MDQARLQQQLGRTRHAPSWALAYKWAGEQAATTVERIEVQVGRSGRATPVAVLAPVSLAGATIRRCALHNFEYLLRHALAPPQAVLVERVGATIPSIRPPSPPLGPPQVTSEHIRSYIAAAGLRCPCQQGGPLVVRDREVLCAASEQGRCHRQLVARIAHFAGKTAMDVPGLGPTTVEKLVLAGAVGSIADLLRLPDIPPAAGIPGLGAGARLQKLLEGIRGVRRRPTTPEGSRERVARVLVAFGIPQVGESAAALLAQHYPAAPQLLSAVRDGEPALQTLLGPAAVDSLRGFFFHSPERDLAIELLKGASLLDGRKGSFSFVVTDE